MTFALCPHNTVFTVGYGAQLGFLPYAQLGTFSLELHVSTQLISFDNHGSFSESRSSPYHRVRGVACSEGNLMSQGCL